MLCDAKHKIHDASKLRRNFLLIRNMLYCQTAFFIALCLNTSAVLGHSERMEWFVYAATACIFPIVTLLGGACLRAALSEITATIASSTIAIASISYAVALGVLGGHVSAGIILTYLPPFAWGIFAGIKVFRSEQKREGQLALAISIGIDTFAWNLLALLGCIAYLKLVMPSIEIALTGGAALACIGVVTPWASIRRKTATYGRIWSRKYKVNLWKYTYPLTWLLFGFLSLALFKSQQTLFDYPHYATVVGPTYDAYMGKSLLWDVPTIYGYLSIYLMAGLLALVDFSFANYYMLHTALYIVYTLMIWFIINSFLKNILVALLISAFLTMLASQANIDPLMGPLRYGLAGLVMLCFCLSNSRISLHITALITAIAMWWAFEIAAQMILAWTITLFIKGVADRGLGVGIFREMRGPLISFAFSISLLSAWILYSEYRPGLGLPSLIDYYGGATIRLKQDSPVGSLYSPFGTYIGAVVLVFVSLGVVADLCASRRSSILLLVLSFSTFHYIALLARHVNNSFDAYIMEFNTLTLLQLTLAISGIFASGRVLSRERQRYFFLPAATMIVCSGWPLAMAFMIPVKDAYGTWLEYNSVEKLLEPVSARPFLTTVLDKYNSMDSPLCLLSPHDTKLLVEAGEINVLPLNPMNTLPHLPRGMERYLKPAVSRMEIGTLVVAARQTYFEMPFSQYRFHPQWYWNEILGTFRVRSFGPAIDSNPSPATVSKGTERIIYDVYVLEERLKENATLEDRVEVILQQIKEDYDFFAAYEYLEELLVEGSEGESGRLGFWSSFIEDHSESAYGRVFLSRALWRAGRYDEALAEAGKAWDRKPDDDAILSNYGNMLVNSGNCADGWEKLGQLVQRPEGNYFNVLSKRLELIRASESCFDDTEYMKLIEEWLELGPDTPQQYIVKLTDYKVKESEL